MAIIKNISRLSELKTLQKVLSGMKTILAHNKQNYAVDLNQIKGTRIADITEDVAENSGERNTIVIKFDDGTRKSLYVYNGSEGDKGKTGIEGEQGNKGQNATVNANRSEKSLSIVNDNVTYVADKVWSAYRGKDMYDKIKAMNETFVTDAEYQLLWNDIVWLKAEFTSTKEDQNVVIFNNDTNDHTVYTKYWTYEDSDYATYYVAIYDETGNIIRYDAVTANLWSDIYLGATNGYFAATNNQMNDEITLYVYDKKKKEYVPVLLVYNDVKDAETGNVASYYLGSKTFDYYVKEIDAYVHTDYDGTRKTYNYSLLADELEVSAYTFDGSKFTQVKANEVDLSDISVVYYYPGVVKASGAATKEEVRDAYKIPSGYVDDYFSTPSVRYFVKQTATTKHKHGDIEINAEYVELAAPGTTEYAPDKDGNYPDGFTVITNGDTTTIKKNYDASVIPSTIDTKNFVEYIVAEYNNSTKTYKFTKFYPKTILKKQYYFNDSVELNSDSIEYYAYTDSRKYFTAKMVSNTDEATGAVTFEQEYTEIARPIWVIAEFTTKDEDQETLLLYSDTELGVEDNTVKDETAEDGGDVVIEEVLIKQIICGDKTPIYKKVGTSYVEVDFNVEDIKESTSYFTKDDGITYVEISGETALDKGDGYIVYVKNDNGAYVANSAAIISTNKYYIATETYTGISADDVKSMLTNCNVTLFNGEPKQVFISLLPSNVTNKILTMDYDASKVALYEDGRIAALENNCQTDIVLKSTDGSDITSTIHVNLTTQVKSIVLDSKSGQINNGDTVTIQAAVLPTTSSDTVVDFVSEDESIATVEYDNNTAVITSHKSGKVNIIAKAHDGYGATAKYELEVITPAESLEWGQSDIKKVTTPAVVWEDYDAVEEYNETHKNDAGFVPVKLGDIITEAYDTYYMTVLMNKEYDLTPIVKPDDTTYPTVKWSTSDASCTVTTGTRKVVDVAEVSHSATQDDIDNNKATELGETVIDVAEVSHTVPAYTLKGTKVLESYKQGSNPNAELVATKNAGDEKTAQVGTPASADYKPAITYTQAEIDEAIAIVNAVGYVTGSNPTAETTSKKLAGMLKSAAVGTPASANYKPATYYTQNEIDAAKKIVEADGYAKITGKITTGTDLSIVLKVRVDQAVEKIEVEPTSLSFNVATSKQLSANILPDTAVNATYRWVSSDNKIVTVSDKGVIKGISAGVAKITAEALDGSGVVGTCDVKITIPAQDILVKGDSTNSKYGIVYVGIGNTTKLNTVITYLNKTIDSTMDEYKLGIVWNTSDSSVATVDNGQVTGVSLGKVTIVASAADGSGVFGTIQVCVIKLATAITFSETDITMDVNESYVLVPTFTPDDTSNEVVIWTSSDSNVAVVNDGGIVTAIAAGETTITAATTDGSNLKAECKITVN